MFKVNNKKTIHLLAKSAFKASKMRNIFGVVAIILTTILLTGFFTIGSSLIASMEESTMRQVGGNAHGSFKYLSAEEYEQLKKDPSIKEISYTVVLGIAENQELAKRPTEIRYAHDEIAAKSMFSLPTTGRLPQNDDEIATDSLVLKRLGIPLELGQQVTLEYTLSGEKQSDTFTLVGFWQGDPLMQTSQAWLNPGYVEKQLENYIPFDQNDFIGQINAEVNFANSFQIDNKLQNVITNSGYTLDEIEYGVNWAYTGNSGSADGATTLGAIAVILMIIFCGYLMISNVFYISVAKDTRYYGLLKTIGTTGKQIRSILARQALLLCVLGVPLGLVMGYFVGALMTPLVLSIINTNVITITPNLMIFLMSALFAILTVIISVAKPSKMAAKVSPIEALRSTDGAQKSKKTTKKNGHISLWRMAQSNVFRNKRKTILVTISLSLSLIILNSAFSMANSFDMDKYLSNSIGSDFALGDASNFNVHLYYTAQETLSPEFLQTLSEKEGLEEINNIYFAEPSIALDPNLADIPAQAEKELGLSGEWLGYLKQSTQSPTLLQHIYGLDQDTMSKLTILAGNLDYEKLQTGDYVIAGPFDKEGKVTYYDIGDKVEIATLFGTSKMYEVLAIATIPNNISIQHSHALTPEFFLASDVFLQDIGEKAPMLTTLEVADDHQEEMESYLSDYCQNSDENMQYSSKATFMAEYENIQRTYKSVGLILSLLVAFIGVMNFINTVVTSIISRKRELAMLQSIGMTDKQTQTMLIYEGLVYTVLTTLFVFTLGSLLGYFALSALTGGAPYLSLRFTIVPSLLCLPILAIISIIVPLISQHTISKSSIIQRLKEIE